MKAITLALAALLAILAMACGDGDDTGDDDTGGAPTVAGTPTPAASDCGANLATPAATGDLTWDAILPADAAPVNGYTLEDAEGDAPIVDVARDGEVVGSLELLQFPLEPTFDTSQGVQALAAWTDSFYAGVEADRGAGDRFQSFGALPAQVGSFCGVSYGYQVADESGDGVSELFIGQATFDATRLYLITAFYDTAQPELGFSDDFVLQDFANSFAEIVAGLGLPAE